MNPFVRFGAEEDIDICTIPSRSPAGKATRTSLELNGPITASALSSSANWRTASAACFGSPLVSKVTTRIFWPSIPPLALISATARSTAMPLVLARLT